MSVLTIAPHVDLRAREPQAPNPAGAKLRVALVNPPDPAESPDYRRSAPLGLGYLAAVARHNGFHVDIYDFVDCEGISGIELERSGLLRDYDVYGFGTYTESFTETMRIARLVHQARPDAKIVLGGYHASIMTRQVLTDFEFVSAIACGEADISFTQLLKVWAGDLPESVEGVVFRHQLAETFEPMTYPSLTIDDLPLPVTELAFQKAPYAPFVHARDRRLRRVAHIVSSRGCPKRCSFCAIIVLSPKWRARTVEDLMAEIAHRYEQEPFEHIQFQDANFFVDFRRTRAFAHALYAFNPDITWSGTATADHVVKHQDVLDEIGGLNCAYLEIGIESGNAASLTRFNKWTDPAMNRRALAMLEGAGIPVGLDFIMFEQEMTLEDLRENVVFLIESNLGDYWPTNHLFSVLKMYPGTPARDRWETENGRPLAPHVIERIPFVDPRVAAVAHAMDQYSAAAQPRTDALVELVRTEIAAQLYERPGVPDGRRVLALERSEIALRWLPFKALQSLVQPGADAPGAAERLLHEALRSAWQLHEDVQRLTQSVSRKERTP